MAKRAAQSKTPAFIVLMHWDDSNMAGFYWTWSVFLRQRRDGSWSLGAEQCVDSGRPLRIRGTYRIRNGRKLKDAIDKLFAEDPLSGDKPDWTEIIDNAEHVDKQMAAELRQAVEVADRRIFLNSYEGDGLAPKWCWVDMDTNESSQEFDSEDGALKARHAGQLQWSRLEDLG